MRCCVGSRYPSGDAARQPGQDRDSDPVAAAASRATVKATGLVRRSGCCISPPVRAGERPNLLGVVSRPTCRAVVSSLHRLLYAYRMPAALAPAYAVLRVHTKKAKTMAAISAASEHHMQTEPSPHHNPEAGAPMVLHLAAGKTPYQAARHLLHNVERRNRETVLCREIVLSASPSCFRPGREEQAGVADPDRLKAWTLATVAWAKKQWPDQLASVVLHGAGREATPHVHILCIPRVRSSGGWKLNSKALFDRARLRDLQTSYADALAPLGIRRGEPGSEAKHVEVKQFYGVVQAAKRGSERPTRTPAPPAPAKPAPPSGAWRSLVEALATALGVDTAYTRSMRSYVAKLSKWREQVRAAREQDEKAWEQLRAAAAMAPIERRRGSVTPASTPVLTPGPVSASKPRLR